MGGKEMSRRTAPLRNLQPQPSPAPIKPKYEDFKPMIISRARSWYGKAGNDLEDLISEGNEVFCYSIEKFDPSKATFSTYFYNSLNIHYMNMMNLSKCKKAPKPASDIDDNMFYLTSISVERETMFRQLVNDLPRDAKEVVMAIFETPAEIIEVLEIKKITKSAIFQYFTQIKGWTQNRVWKAFNKVQQAIN
jgi:hypothetical protein